MNFFAVTLPSAKSTRESLELLLFGDEIPGEAQISEQKWILDLYRVAFQSRSFLGALNSDTLESNPTMAGENVEEGCIEFQNLSPMRNTRTSIYISRSLQMFYT